MHSQKTTRTRFRVGGWLQLGLLLAVSFVLAACSQELPIPGNPDFRSEDGTPVPAPTVLVAEPASDPQGPRLLSDPFLQLPTEDSVRVVWFTNFGGLGHTLTYTPTGGTPVITAATTTRMSRLYEDERSQMAGRQFEELTERPVWRHEAIATGLVRDERIPYEVASITDQGITLGSEPFSLQPLPSPGTAMQILLTSDQQNRQMSPANFQKVIETVGLVDAVFFAGDLVDNPHRASEWFDRYNSGWLGNPGEAGEPAFPGARPAFFPALQGNYQELFPEFPYTGGPILQHAPLFGSIGNHESPGRWRPVGRHINQMDNDPQPRWYAEIRYAQQADDINPTGDPAIREQWIRDNSYEWTTYLEMWSLPDDGPQGEAYYAYQIGDVFVISMNVSRVWRTWDITPEARGKFSERAEALNNPDEWGFGDMWFEQYHAGSEQYQWLTEVFASEAFQNAPYRVVIAHQTMFGLGDNAVPVMADPVATIAYTDGGITMTKTLTWPLDQATWEAEVEPLLGSITEIRYAYPLDADVWRNDIEPLLIENGVDLVHVGHSHVWNRAEVEGLHYIETSNVGNSFGAYYADDEGTIVERAAWATSIWDELARPDARWNAANYPRTGDAHNRAIAFPTEFNPMAELDPLEENNRPVPYVSSNNLTVFTILDTADGTVSSYVFDTRDPDSAVRLFDQFVLAAE